MKHPLCQIKGCENNALILYGNRWICGDCCMKIVNKKAEQQEEEFKLLEEEL